MQHSEVFYQPVVLVQSLWGGRDRSDFSQVNAVCHADSKHGDAKALQNGKIFIMDSWLTVVLQAAGYDGVGIGIMRMARFCFC